MSWQHLLIVLLIVLLLFGASQLPKLAKSMGQSARIFKDEVKEFKKDDTASEGRGDESPAVEGRVIDGERTARPAPESERHDQR
ncbi:twin-arginine translocase TatA/TatE family subunit [Nesterenkonia sp. NBAIMH1]|uniref:twin-arginine translocase TatA/TatE family subunit n=1 Tax=Nesterenkonia sp. NBAIMH1 TaxID=2600320 RepID=UPI0011B5077B|nr:twin-arginine translocase TatA/TatE family subunit [Nesterenkonia sp. NBAIMH1]